MAALKWKRIVAIATAAVSFGGSQPCSVGADPITIGHSSEVSFQGTSDSAQSGWLFVPYAQFKIPFNIEPGGSSPTQVQLWVSTDNGNSWQLHSSLGTDKRFFEFRAAGEGSYLFAVQTRDAAGAAYPSPQPPMRVIVDTTRPETSIHVDVDSTGRLIAQFEIAEQHLNTDSIQLEFRTDKDTQWQQAVVDGIQRTGQTLRGHAVIAPAQCREVFLRLSLSDLAQNKSEATANFVMPRTAAAASGMQLASKRGEPTLAEVKSQQSTTTEQPELASPFGVGPTHRASGPNSSSPTPGGTLWNVDQDAPPSIARSANPTERNAAGQKPVLTSLKGWTDARSISGDRSAAANQTSDAPSAADYLAAKRPANATVVGSSSANGLGSTATQHKSGPGNFPVSAMPEPEELPAPKAVGEAQPELALDNGPNSAQTVKPGAATKDAATADIAADSSHDINPSANSESAIGGMPSSLLSQAYHSRSRAFSLDYAVDSLRGSQISDVELWGTEDGGRTWTKWGSDPDRESPFDVQVADDGLFGFRMVVVGNNGLVSNRPKNGDDADAWINVDSVKPSVKITRAVYGQGSEAGMLVIDYKCEDNNLHDRPVTLSFSDHQSGPWTTIASGLRNTGVYLWKASPDLPKKIYLRIEATDRGGNVASHQLDLPIAIEGLAPRGRIQGFRPLDNP